MYTNLGSFHRGPQLVCLSLCLLSSDNVLSECRPNDERDRLEFIHNRLEKMTGLMNTLDGWLAASSP